jgi:glycosyltransferase involved in cell wall biosynthesis
MKILQLVTRRQFRGAEVFAAELSKQLLQRNHAILFVGLYAPANPPLEIEGAKHIDLITQKPRFFSITLLRKLIQLIKTEKPDIIQANGSDTLKYVVTAKLFAKLPPITYRNISMISVWITSPIKKWWVKTVMNQVDYVTSVGEFARQDFIKTLKYPELKIQVISRGIPIQPQHREEGKAILKKRFPHIGDNDTILMHIGNFSPEKNHRFLLEVMEILKQKNPAIRLICLGEGVLWKEIENLIKLRKLDDHLLLFGFYNQPGQLLAAAEVSLLCSTVEGVPGVILEAGSHKVPAVAVNVGGVQEVVIDGKTGFLLPDFNPTAFADKVMELIDNNALRTEMGTQAHHLAQQNYDLEINADKFEQLYNQLRNNRE